MIKSVGLLAGWPYVESNSCYLWYILRLNVVSTSTNIVLMRLLLCVFSGGRGVLEKANKSNMQFCWRAARPQQNCLYGVKTLVEK